MSPRVLSAVLLAVAGPALAGEMTNAARMRAANFSRPGWVVVDGNFARPQATIPADTLFGLVDTGDQLSVVAKPAPTVEPLLRNYRTALIRLAGDDAAFKISCPNRVWNDTRSAGTQHLLLTAATDVQRPADGTPGLFRVDITPPQQTVEVRMDDDGVPQTVVLVFGRDFIEASVGPNPAKPQVLIRSTTARQLLRDRPTEVRRYVVPVLTLLNHGVNPIGPGAADVYRAFPGLPADPVAAAAVAALLPGLASAGPAERRQAVDGLRALGPRGVQAMMALDPSPLSPEAAERVAGLIAEASHDTRTPEQLRADPTFRLDCLRDADPNVRAAAGRVESP